MSHYLKLFAFTAILAFIGCSVDINPGSFSISVTPTSNDFGVVNIGESVQVKITVKNNTNETVYVTDLRIDGLNYNSFTILSGGTVPLALDSKVEHEVIVSFTPTSEGNLEASLFVSFDADGSPIEVKFVGIGNFGEGIVLVPGTVNFGDILIGDTKNVDLTLSNGTEDFLTITNITIEGFNPADFTILSGGTTPTDVPPKSVHIITIEFAPSEVGPRDGLVSIEYDGMIDPLQAVLVGNGIMASSFEINPMMYDFGNVGIGASVNADVTITNTGNADLIVSVIEIIDDAELSFEITDGIVTSDVSISPGGTHKFTITFTPATIGLKTAKFSITHSGDGMPFVGELSGTGSDLPSISPNSHDFGSVNIGNTTAPFTFTITNPTAADISVTDTQFTGADASAFALLPGAPSLVVPANGGTLELDVTFTPSKNGAHTASFDVTLDSGGPLSAQLLGTGTATPEFSISPSGPYDFGVIPFNSSEIAEFTVTNIGSGTLSLTSITIQNDSEGNFSITAGGSPTDITTNPHIIEVTFSPVSAGPKSATLRIVHNASGSPNLITLTGEGATVNISPTSHNFGNVVVGTASPPSQTFVITNSTGSAITVTNVEITGTDASEFSAAPSGAMSQNVAPGGGTMNVVVTCDPTKTGALAATLTVTHSLGNISATLSATGTGSPVLTVTPTSFNFGTLTLTTPKQNVSQSFTVENTGTGTLSITSITIQGVNRVDFTITAGGSAVNLGAGDTHTVTVEFEPTHYGRKLGAIKFVHNGVSPASPYYVQLYGNAVGADFVLIPEVSVYSMGDGFVNKTKTKGFYIKNGGNQTLNVSSISISNTTDFALRDAGSRNLAPGDISYLYLDFTPQTTGNKGATLTINHNSAGSPHTVTISGNGIASSGEVIENFDGSSAPSGWGYTGIWQWGIPSRVGPSRAHSGSRCFGTRISSNYIRNQYCYLITPSIDMSAALSPKMTFYMWLDTYHWSYANYNACGWIETSTNGGNTWSRSVSPDPAYNSSATVGGDYISVWGGYNGALFRNWREVNIDLASLAGNSNVMIAFYFYSANYYYTRAGWYIDTVSIYDEGVPYPYYPGPQDNDITTKVSGNNYTLKWNCFGATTYDVYFGTTNPPTTRVARDITPKQHTVAVAAGRKYFWRVDAKKTAGTFKSKVFYFETVSSHPTVLINEIETGSVDWIEFYNPGATAVYIGGYQCTIYSKSNASPDGTFTFPEYLLLKPEETIVFHDENAASTYSNRVDFDFDWTNSAHGIEVILKKHSFYPNTGVDYVKINTLPSTHKPSDLNWSGAATSNLTNWYNWYRNSGTDNDSASDWTVRRYTADKDAKNPGQ